jgi:hypothetical protein
MNTNNDPTNDTLANLAAQVRFAKLSASKAVQAALKLWHLAGESLQQSEVPQHDHRQSAILKPKEWPVPLHVFYRLTVSGRHEGDSETKLLRFLPQYMRRSVLGLREATEQDALSKAKERLRVWKMDGIDEATWEWLAQPYKQWWDTMGKREAKRAGGNASAKKRAEERNKKANERSKKLN